MRKFMIMLICFLITGCAGVETPIIELAEPADKNINTSSTGSVYIKPKSEVETKFGIYLTNSSMYESITNFEKSSSSHEVYGLEMNIKEPLPIDEIRKIRLHGKTPFLTVYVDGKIPPNAYELLNFSQSIGNLNIPIYVNIAPFTSNSWKTIEIYKGFWATAAKSLKYNAKKAIVVWSVFKDDMPLYEEAVPNEELFSYAGLMFYGDSENGETEFFNSLNHLMKATNKDIIISSLAISNFSTEDHIYKTEQAVLTLEKIYWNLKESYPRVYAILYMDKDLTVSSPQNTICNDYRITSENTILSAYTHILSVNRESNYEYYKIPFDGQIIDNNPFVREEVFYHCGLTVPKDNKNYKPQGYIQLEESEKYTFWEKDKDIYIKLN